MFWLKGSAIVIAGLLPLIIVASGSAKLRVRSCPPSQAGGMVRMVVAPRSIEAGQSMHFRIDNSLGPTVFYGTDYSIQECVAGVWMLAPFTPTVSTRQRIAQRPGRGRWSSVPIPTTAEGGEYRIRKVVGSEEGNRWLYGQFGVSAPGAE